MDALLTFCLLFLFVLPSNQLSTQRDALRSIRSAARSNRLQSISWSSPPFPMRNDSQYLTKAKDGLKQQKEDLITNGLPGQPAGVNFAQYSGYIPVDASSGRALFYYFTQAALNSSSKPLLLWLNGGPGCSSLGYGAMAELGPFRVNADGGTLRRNPYAWNNVANLLFLESPAGVGFSFSKRKSDYRSSGDAQTAKDSYAFLVNWFERFPQYKNRDFFIAGESYAGNYVPELAATILEHKKQSQASFINLKGLMVGNADMSIDSDNAGAYMYAWSHALISDETYEKLMEKCIHIPFVHPNDSYCIDLQNKKYVEMGNIDPYAIYAPRCIDDLPTKALTAKKQNGDQYDPCIDKYVTKYMNRPEVQKAFHVNKVPYEWSLCNDIVFQGWKDYVPTVLPIYQKLISAGLRILIFSGDTDSVVPISSTRMAIKSMNLAIKKPWYSWPENGRPDAEVGGYSVIYKGNFIFASVREAGHEVPFFQPVRALNLVSHFLAGHPLPSQHG